MTYKEIQYEVIKKYRIDICDGTRCEDGDWSRMHAHPKKRRVCKWKPTNSVVATFNLFHEIGHVETHTGKMRRCESEYAATVWAIERMREYGIVSKISEQQKKLYQDYILRERDRGVRRGGLNYPSRQQLTLRWE